MWTTKNRGEEREGTMGELIELREIPRGQLEKDLETAARKLKPDPGANHGGNCEMFHGADHFPVCRGQCAGGAPCHLVVIGSEGSHSDLHNYLAFCTCMTKEELNKLIGGRAEIVEIHRPK
jgi:hypothetical protein